MELPSKVPIAVKKYKQSRGPLTAWSTTVCFPMWLHDMAPGAKLAGRGTNLGSVLYHICSHGPITRPTAVMFAVLLGSQNSVQNFPVSVALSPSFCFIHDSPCANVSPNPISVPVVNVFVSIGLVANELLYDPNTFPN